MIFFSRYLFCWLFVLCFSGTAFSQIKHTLSAIEEKLASLEKDGSEELKAVWKAAADFKKSLSDSEAKTEEYTEELKEYEKKKARLESLKFDLEISEPSEDLKLSDVETKLEQLGDENEDVTLELNTLKQLEKSRVERTGQIPKQIREAKNKLEKIQPIENASSGEVAIDKAKYQLDLAAKDYYLQYIQELEVEQKMIEVGAPVLKAEKRIAEQKAVYYSEILELWKERLAVLKAKEAATDKERIKQQIIDYSGVSDLRKMALDNLELLEELEELRASLELDSSVKRLNEIQAELNELKTNKEYAEKRIDQLEGSGLSIDRATGALLRQQANALTNTGEKELNKEIKKISGDYTETQLRLLELNNKRNALPQNTEEFLNDLSKELKLNNITVDEARGVITEKEKLLTELINIKLKIRANQSEQIVKLKEKMAVTESYSKFINERLIWIANAKPISLSDPGLEIKGISSILSDRYLGSWLVGLRNDFLQHYVIWLVALLSFGFLLWWFKHCKALVGNYHKSARRRNCQSFKPTVKGLFLELIIALPMPFLFGFIAWRSVGEPVFELSFAVASVFSFLVGLAWGFSRANGLIVSNFKLNDRQSKIIHNTMGWFFPVMLPLLMLFLALRELPSPEPPAEYIPYGRMCYIITMVITMLALFQLFRPKHRLLNDSRSDCIIAKIVFSTCMFVPFILIVGAWLGYYSTALLFRGQFLASIWIIVFSLFVAALLNRWFLVSSRKIAIKQALKRREALIKEREQAETDDPESKISTKSAEEVEAEAVNVAGVKEQTTRLVRVALICSLAFTLWGIWSQSLDALSVLDRQKLWEQAASVSSDKSSAVSNPITDIVSGSGSASSKSESAAVAGEYAISSREENKENWVSLQDLLFSIIIFILTYVAARNIPGLLEITILDNLNIKSGAAFALTTTVRYLIVLFGIIWAFGNIGVTWSSIQWIAAAVTLGIGFGLQEVFANFVAGLILLYERPIRLGDVVTVGEVSGKVTQIKIRATTVQQFNNHELIVPNKEFITGQLTNWTLNDNIIRVEVLVGIAYGSDTVLAEKVLMKVAKDHPKVLNTPAPDVLFLAFGASSLDFQLRCFVAGYDDFRPTQSELHFHVNDAFAKAGIEISFPQQDLHIKTVEKPIPLEVAKMIAADEKSDLS